MRLSDKWKDYELIDTSDGERLERWGDIILIRPDPQIIWSSEKKNPLWYSAHARYHRSNRGGGSWEQYKKVPDRWTVNYGDLVFNIKPMGFKHTGVFPEQAVNWDFAAEKIKNENGPLKILNLFGYTGCATLACMNAGATVCHVDASKGMVQWAKENAASSGIADRPVRWLVDDCVKFVQREIRRGNRYDGIIMDPPSYGRGPGGEVWKLEEQLYSLVTLCKQVLSDNPLFFILNSYTTGLSPAVMCVNNETGAIMNVTDIFSAVKAKNSDVICHTDAVQAFGKISLSASRLHADLISVSGHKIHAPKGVGAIFVKKGVRLVPLHYGGEQEKKLRPGTEAIPLIAAMGVACGEFNIDKNYDYVSKLNSYAKDKLLKIDGVVLNSPENALPYVLNISAGKVRSETMLHFFENLEVYVSSGSACAKGKPSYVLESMNIGRDRADSALRISFSKFNTEADIDALCYGIEKGLKTLAHK